MAASMLDAGTSATNADCNGCCSSATASARRVSHVRA